MPDAREVYEHHPAEYDALVRREDREGNLLRVLGAAARLDGADAVELGAGTGRLTRLLAPRVRSVRAFDASGPMLAVARSSLEATGLRNWHLEEADNGALPVADACADLAVAGWTLGHQTVWHPERWREPVDAAVREMLRVLRPGGTAVIVETLGTGHETPFEPPPELARCYAALEGDWRFERTWIRTDYEFASVEEGARLVGFFFGDAMRRAFEAAGRTVLPECTGIWSRRR